jgi:superfamily II DNA/RNA helicase
MTSHFLRDPINILVKKERLTLDGIKQYYVALERDEWKYTTICDIYSQLNISQSIIYCNSKRRAELLTEQLREDSFTVSCMHGGMEPGEREAILKEFRTGSSRILITTDLLARGIDIQQISIVINYDIPKSKEEYLHRIGRSGRYGRKGIGINFVTAHDVRLMQDIEIFYSTQIMEMPTNFIEGLT